MSDISRVDRARGCLLASAVGDALGAPLEGLSAPQVQAHYGTVEGYVDGSIAWKKKPYRWRMPGLYSDDTQQAMALADSLIAHGRIVPASIVAAYRAMANPKGAHLGCHRGVARSFKLVLGEWERGADPAHSGQCGAGIGAAMRVAPLAVFHRDDPEALFDDALAAGQMTHRDCRSLAGSFAAAYTARRLLAGEPRGPSLLLRVAGEVSRAERRLAALPSGSVAGLKEHRDALSTAIAHVEKVIDAPRERALAAIVDEANRHGADPACRKPTMGFPPVMIPTCLYLLIRADTLEDALTDVVNLGGDADTAGAILGSWAGAHWGVGAIPGPWLDGLANVEGICLRADALAGEPIDPAAIPDLLATERQLTEGETLCRERLAALRQSNGGDMGANRRL